MIPLRVFIGFDERQPLAYMVAHYSIVANSSAPVMISPLIQSQLPVVRRGLTSFTFTRYLVPYLCEYEGTALFLDADVLCLGDIAELPWHTEDSVCVVPHTTVEKNGKPFSVQFERPSVMLFKCEKCKRLTPEYIESASPQSFAWAESVGELPTEWNHLVGYDQMRPAKLIHYTQGIPCFPETKDDDYGQEWREAMKAAMATVSWEAIMGNSVHAQWKR